MIPQHTNPPVPPAPVEIDRARGLIRLRDAKLFGAGGEADCERFLRRVFTVDGVDCVAVDTREGCARIRVHKERVDSLVSAIATAIRGAGAELPPAALPYGARGTCYQVRRAGARLTSWQMREDRTGLIHLRHQLLRADHVKARRVERLVSSIPGVAAARASRWTGSLFIEYDSFLVDRDLLIHLAEQALAESDLPSSNLALGDRARYAIANVNLGLATLADLGVAPFSSLTAILLVGTNLKTFAEAGGQIRRRELGLPVLYTSIVAGTLASGQFLASAIMMWMFVYWKRREVNELSAEHQLLLEDHVGEPRAARKNAAGRELLVPCSQLRPGERVLVKTGDVVPADGKVAAGEGVVDEQCVSGTDGAARKRPGARVLAGSIVLFGQFQIEIERLGEETRAASIRRALAMAMAPAAARSKSRDRTRLAERAVVPTLATAGLGLAVGDIHTAVAVLRPDYATGPTLAGSLLSIGDVRQCLSRGIVVRDPGALDRLAQADHLVIADYPELERPELSVAAVDTRSSEVGGLLQLAASIGRHLDGQRGTALAAASRARNLPLLNLPPIDLNGGIGVRYGQRFIRLRDLDELSDDGPLSIEIDGRPVATIHFKYSNELAAAGEIARLRSNRRLRVILATERTESDAGRLARRLGADDFRAGLANGSLTGYLRDCRTQGQRVAVVGPDRVLIHAASEAHVTVGIVDRGDGALCQSAAVTLLEPSISSLVDVWEIASARSVRARNAHRLTLVPNVLCVAGAFFLGFTSLVAVIVSNLGTFGSFSIAAEQLRRSHRVGRRWHRPLSIVSRGSAHAARHVGG